MTKRQYAYRELRRGTFGPTQASDARLGSYQLDNTAVLVRDAMYRGDPPAYQHPSYTPVFTDDFAVVDTSKWRDKTTQGAWNANERIVNGQLVLDCLVSYAAHLESTNTYDLTNKFGYIEIVGRPAQGGDNSTEMYFGIRNNTNASDYFEFIIGGSGAIAYSHALGNVNQPGGGSVSYDPVSMRFLRIWHDGVSVAMQTAPTANGAWTTRASWVPAWPTNAVRFYMYTGFYGTQASPGTAIYDNFSTDGVVAPPGANNSFFFMF